MRQGLVVVLVIRLSQNAKTYNSWYSLVVTHPTTNQPISSLCMAERTGCPVFLSLWSYVKDNVQTVVNILTKTYEMERNLSIGGYYTAEAKG